MRITIIAANFDEEEEVKEEIVLEEIKPEPEAPKKKDDDIFDGIF